MDIAGMEGVDDGSGQVLFYSRTKRGRKKAKIKLPSSMDAGEPGQNVYETIVTARKAVVVSVPA